jgi:hypothetical protein
LATHRVQVEVIWVMTSCSVAVGCFGGLWLVSSPQRKPQILLREFYRVWELKHCKAWNMCTDLYDVNILKTQ